MSQSFAGGVSPLEAVAWYALGWWISPVAARVARALEMMPSLPGAKGGCGALDSEDVYFSAKKQMLKENHELGQTSSWKHCQLHLDVSNLLKSDISHVSLQDVSQMIFAHDTTSYQGPTSSFQQLPAAVKVRTSWQDLGA